MADYRLAKTGPKIDDILENSTRQDAIAIVSNGNTHIAITSGQYVYVKNHGTLSEGMYRATTNIAANAALSSSNVTLEQNGVANALKSAMLKYISVQLPLSALGTSWSPTSRYIGTAQNWFGVPGSKILSIAMYGANFSPAANAIFALYNDDIYVAATQDTTLSDINSDNRWINVIYHD